MDNTDTVVQNAIFALNWIEKEFGSAENCHNEVENLANEEITCRCGFIRGAFKDVRFTLCPQCNTAPSLFEPGTELYKISQRQAREACCFIR